MLVIKNAKVFTSAHQVYEKADILINGQHIEKVGENLPIPDGAQIIDAEGLTVIPGIVDAHSHVGTFGVGGEDRQCYTAGGGILRN